MLHRAEQPTCTNMFIVMFPIAKTCSSDGFEELASVSLGFGRKFKSLYFHEGHKHSMGWHANRMKNCELDVVKDRKKIMRIRKEEQCMIWKKQMRLNEWQSCLLSYLWNIIFFINIQYILYCGKKSGTILSLICFLYIPFFFTHQLSFLHALHHHEINLLCLIAVVVECLLYGYQKLVSNAVINQPTPEHTFLKTARQRRSIEKEILKLK